MDRVSAFWIGNVIGLAILVVGVVLTAPKKLKESAAVQQKQPAVVKQVRLLPPGQ